MYALVVRVALVKHIMVLVSPLGTAILLELVALVESVVLFLEDLGALSAVALFSAWRASGRHYFLVLPRVTHYIRRLSFGSIKL